MQDTLTAIGLMSGTSMDGVDVALIKTDGKTIQEFGPTSFSPYSSDLRSLVMEAMEVAQFVDNREDRSGALGAAEIEVTRAHIQAIRKFSQEFNVSMQMVDLIGFHGQTVIHAPDRRLTMQLGSGVQIYEAFGVPTVCDFRADDVEKGGQGAPLVPVYHRALADFNELERPVAIVNIGGVANVTWIGHNDEMLAFDTGPGNGLIDDWIALHLGQPMDLDGKIAASGKVNQEGLYTLLDNPYFHMRPPKSLDRKDFNFSPVENLSLASGAATLTAFTAYSLAKSSRHMPEFPTRWIVTGGGAKNPVMCEMLQEALEVHGDCEVLTGSELGWDGDFVEAQAFAYLAVRTVKGRPITFPGTTGIKVPSEGGVIIGGYLI